MDTSKIIKGIVNGRNYTVTSPIVKEDYGLVLQIEGVELPPTYQVDFSNSESNGTSVTMIGNADGVLIPHQFISTGKDVFAFLYHVGEDFGRTVYKFRIPNKVRPDRTNEEPTPEEQSVIDQAISALNSAVAQTAQDVIDADASASAASQSESNAHDSELAAQGYAQTASDKATLASQKATVASNSADQAAQIKTDIEGYVSTAQGYAQTASDKASQASQSATTASNKANEASGYANTASQKASDASGYASTASTKAGEASNSASTALGYKTDAENAKIAAQTAQGKAEDAQTAAETARAGSESARDEAVTANTSAQQSESAMRDMLAEYSDVATEATAQEILRREEDGLAFMEFALRALDNRLDTMVEDLPHDTTGQQLAEALNYGNSMLNALYNELANEEV